MSEPITKRLARGLIGLAAGVAVGTFLGVLVVEGTEPAFRDVRRAAYAIAHFVTTGRVLQGNLDDAVAQTTWEVSLLYACLAAAIAAPLWMLLAKFGRKTRLDALLLGAGVGGLIGCLAFNGQIPPLLEFAPVGVAAGLVTWLLAHRPTSSRPAP